MQRLIKTMVALITVMLVSLALSSCGECEDETLEVSDELKNYLPYTDQTSVTFSNMNGDAVTYTISPDVRIRENENRDCITSLVQPFIIVENEEQPEFILIRLTSSDEIIGPNRDQLFASFREDGDFIGAGLISEINNPSAVATTVTLNDKTFDEVIIFDVGFGTETIIYLQNNVGLIGLQYEGLTWVID